MKVFITGANGYVGRNLVRYFHDKNHQVIALVRSPDNAKFLAELGVQTVIGDIQLTDLSKHMKNADVLIHAAADTDHKNQSQNQFQTNAVGTKNVFDSAKAAGVKKAILMSTDSVLLTGSPMTNLTEAQAYPNTHVGEYSRTKQLAELAALNSSSNDFEVIILRPRFIWGKDDTTALPTIVKAVRENKFAWISGGEYLTSTTHISNLCHAVDCAIQHGRQREIYFVSDDKPIKFRDMISKLLETQGIKAPTKSVPRQVLWCIANLDQLRRILLPATKPLPITLQEYSTSALEITLDISKARRELKYIPLEY
jgi:Nucleoside-diphosphate-sugar epimerases